MGHRNRLWHRGGALRTVADVFLLAYADLRRGDRTGLTSCTARSLRRVGADVAIILHCPDTGAKRLRRDARYDHVIAYTLAGPGGDIDVTVLSDTRPSLRHGPTPGSILCDLALDGRDASVTAVDEPAAPLYRFLLRVDGKRPVIVVGDVTENLDDPRVIDDIMRAGFTDTHPARPSADRKPRTNGILARGLRSYGDGTYTDPDGCEVHWARLGY